MSVSAKENSVTETIVRFLNEIGIETHEGDIAEETFVPGIEVRGGALIYDSNKLKYPGDLLHEAGHLAVMTPEERSRANATVDTGPGEEMAAIAWSYAAALHIDIDPAVVFHPDGYKGESQAIIENFANGHYLGVPYLEWTGMTVEKTDSGDAYPKMVKWLRD